MSRNRVKKQAKYILSKLDCAMCERQDHKMERKNGFKILSEKMAQDMKKIKTDNSESIIYRLDQFILKVPKSAVYHDNIIRSYYIGMILNNLKCILPNFVTTKDIFMYNKQVIVSQEYIPGDTLENLLVKKKITFCEFLNAFVQILFALEIAQRQYRFCHYDLHLKNIIMKPITKPYEYSILIDTKRYDLVAEKYIPTIIDFGFASINIDNYTVGSYDFPKFGMMHFLIQGVDMYKFLFHAYAKSNSDIHRYISSLFLFYGSYDPYRLLITPTEQIFEISKTYLKKVSFSRAATYTPLEMFLWIANSPEYKIDVTIKDRDIYLPVEGKHDIFFPESSSYLTAKYVEKISRAIQKIDEIMITSDIEMLMGYKSIEIPDEFSIRDKTTTITNIEIGKHPVKLYIKFIDKMKQYLDCLYTIRELNLENAYETFVSEFVNSKHYLVYNNISFDIEKARRWEFTLEEAIKSGL